jgi:hypothetical protein
MQSGFAGGDNWNRARRVDSPPKPISCRGD